MLAWFSRMIEWHYILKYLQDKQKTEGGYTGNDLTIFAEQLGVTKLEDLQQNGDLLCF